MNENHKVLILEDQMMLAFGLKSILEANEYVVVGPVGNVAEAQSLGHDDYDAAILDINLGNENDSTGFADELSAAGTPFLFLSGYGSAAPLDERFNKITRLRKPVSEAVLINAIQHLLDPS